MRDLEQAKDELRNIIPPGSKVEGEIRRIGKNGMNYDVALFAVPHTGHERQEITGQVAAVLNMEVKNRGIRVAGNGLGATVFLREELSKTLYGSPRCLYGYENEEVKQAKAELSKKDLQAKVGELKTAWKPSDCKKEQSVEQTEPAQQVRRRLM